MNMKIVIVDDDELSRKLLARSLDSQGFSTKGFSNGHDAIDFLGKNGPALLVLDYEMPNLNGTEICELIRGHQNEEVAESPIILLTAHTGEEHEIESLKAGANDFVSKPVNMAVLTARIETQLRLHALRSELQEQKNELERWRQTHELDLEAARLTQQAIIPQRFPNVTAWDFAARYEPLIQVGGDLYDCLALPGDRVLVWIADATGHGASAALLTTLAKLLFRHAAAEHQELADMMNAVDTEFRGIFRGRSFMTVFCALLEGRSGGVSVCGAGHPPALIVRPDGETEQLVSSAPPLGVNRDGAFRVENRTLAASDTLLLYTDGIYSGRDADGARWTASDFLKLLPSAGDSASAFLNAIFTNVKHRLENGTLSDDVALFAAMKR
jgi:phosphoserine phosphatase RsbU/P